MMIVPAPRRFQPPAALALAVALASACARGQDERALRYRLKTGDCLLYEQRATRTTLDADQPLAQRACQLRIWCLERRGDESLLLVDLRPTGDAGRQRSGGVTLHVDDGGRRRVADEVTTRLGPLEAALDLLPVLPSAAQRETEWVTAADLYGRCWSCVQRGPDADQGNRLRIDFTVQDAQGRPEVLGQTRSGSFWFDAAGGCVARLEAEEQDRYAGTRTRVVAELRQRAAHSSEWASRRAVEAERFERTLRSEDRLLQQVITQPDDLARTLRQLDELWLGLTSDVDRGAASPFAELADARRRQLRTDEALFRQEAALDRRWLNRPAGTWSLLDADGQTVTSESARRGVVIEAFWSTESVWSLRALESLRRLQTDLGRQPVRILSCNLDEDPDVGRAAVRQFSAGLAHVLAGPLRSVESLPQLPVVRVLDRKGVVRGVWIGWQPTYGAARELAIELAKEKAP